MRNNLGQRIDPRTSQPYNPESSPVPQHTRSDPPPAATRSQPEAEPHVVALSQPYQGLEEHFLRSEFRRTEGAVTPSPVSSRASPRHARTLETDTAQGPPRNDSAPVSQHLLPPLPWMPDERTFATDGGSQISTSIRRTFEAYQDPNGWAWRHLSRQTIEFYWQQFQVRLCTSFLHYLITFLLTCFVILILIVLIVSETMGLGSLYHFEGARGVGEEGQAKVQGHYASSKKIL